MQSLLTFLTIINGGIFSKESLLLSRLRFHMLYALMVLNDVHSMGKCVEHWLV